MPVQIEQLIARIRRDPRDLDAYSSLKKLYRQQGDLASLAAFLESWARSVGDDQSASAALQEAADAALDGLKDLERSVRLYLQALQRNPFNSEAYERVYAVLEGRGEHRKLLDITNDYLRSLQARNAEAAYVAFVYFRRAELINKHLGRSEQALNDYFRAIELDPTLLAAIYEAREIYLANGQPENAAKLYHMEADAETDPERKAALLCALAQLRAEQLGDLEGAVAALRAALSAMPSDLQTMHELAICLLKRAESKDEESAASDYRKAAELFYQIAQAVTDDKAIEYLQSALNYAPYHDGALDLLEQLAERNGKPDILPAHWVAYIASAPEGPEVDRRRFRLCSVYTEYKQFEEAIFCIQPLAEQGNRQAVKLLADLQSRLGRGAAAEAAPESAAHPAAKAAAEPAAPAAAIPPEPEKRAAAVEPAPKKKPAAPEARETIPPAKEARPEPTTGTSLRITQLREAVQKLIRSDSYDEAAGYSREILTLDPSDPEAFAFLEGYYRKKRDSAQLRDLLLSTTRVPGLSVEARKLRLREVAGISETKLRDMDGAISAWRAVTALDPADAEATQTLKRLLEKAKNWNELVQVLDREALSATDSEMKAELLGQIAKIHQHKRNDIQEAAEAYRQLYLLRPHDKETRDALCDAFFAIENYADAVPLLKERIEECADEKQKLLLLRKLAAVLVEKVAAPEEAFQVCLQMLELAPKDKNALDYMERIDQEIGRFDRLLETLQRRLEITSKAERQALLVRMGSIADRELSDLNKSAEYYSQALELAPKGGEVLDALLSVFERAEKYTEVVELLREYAVIEKNPEMRAELMRRAARILVDKVGDEEDAADIWKSLLDITEDAEGLRFMRSFAAKRGDVKYLSDVLRRLAARTDDKAERRDLLFERAELFDAKLGRSQEALAILRQIVVDLDPEFEPALEKMIAICEKVDDHRMLAEALERKLAKTGPFEQRIALAKRLADLYQYELNDLGRAIEALRKWEETDSANVEPRRRLRELWEKTEKWNELLATLDALAELESEYEKQVLAIIAAAETAYQKLNDTNGSWNRLAPLVRQGDKAAQEAIHKLARAAGLEEALAGIYVTLAQEAADAEQQALNWESASRIYEEYLNNSAQALEAALRRFATDLNNRSYLADVERLAAKAKAWERLSQVYERLLKGATKPEEKVEILLRQAEVLDHQAKDASGAFDRVLRACALDPTSDMLLELAEDLGPRANRCEELLVVYDRRRARGANNAERVEFLLRAAKLSDNELQDRERANGYLKQALALTESSPELVEKIEETACELDKARGKTEEAGARRALVKACRDMADKASPDFASRLILDAARLLSKEFQDEEAIFDVLRHGTGLLPTDDRLQDELESVATRLKRLDAVDAHLARLVDNALDSKTAMLLLERRGKLLENVLKRPSDAAEVYAKLLQLSPDHEDAKRGQHACLKEAGRYQDLLLAIDKQLQRTGDVKEKLDLRKKISAIWEVELKNRWEALDAWKKVLELDASDEEAAQAVARLGRRSLLPPSEQEDLFAGEEPVEEPPAAAAPSQEAAKRRSRHAPTAAAPRTKPRTRPVIEEEDETGPEPAREEPGDKGYVIPEAKREPSEERMTPAVAKSEPELSEPIAETPAGKSEEPEAGAELSAESKPEPAEPSPEKADQPRLDTGLAAEFKTDEIGESELEPVQKPAEIPPDKSDNQPLQAVLVDSPQSDGETFEAVDDLVEEVGQKSPQTAKKPPVSPPVPWQTRAIPPPPRPRRSPRVGVSEPPLPTAGGSSKPPPPLPRKP